MGEGERVESGAGTDAGDEGSPRLVVLGDLVLFGVL